MLRRHRDELIVRAGPHAHEAALARSHCRKMDFTGKSLKGFIYVAPPGFSGKRDLARWVAMGIDFVSTLPAK